MAAAHRTSENPRVTRLRWIIIAFVAALVIIVGAYGLLYSSGVTEGEFVAGEHFEVIETGHRRRPGAPVEVLEFFSYACVHCKNFDPLIERWQKGLDDGVNFRRQPVAFSPIWALLGRTYLTLEQMQLLDKNHERIFRAVHDQGKQFLTPEMMAEFIDGHGTDAEGFLKVFNSADVRRKAARMESLARDYQVNGVPALIVGGRYVVNMSIGRKLSLSVVDHLVEKIHTEEAALKAQNG